MSNRERWTESRINRVVAYNNREMFLGRPLASRLDYPCNTCRDLQNCEVAFDPYNANVPIEDCLGNK